jgi:ankyrin repeat protein
MQFMNYSGLLAGGANPDFRNNLSQTALMVAAYKRYTGIAKSLIRRGAEVDAQDQCGVTAMA